MFASAASRSESRLRSRRGLSIAESVLVLTAIVGIVGGLWCWQGTSLNCPDDPVLPTANSGHNAAVYAVVITPDQQNIMTIGLGGMLRTFSFATGDCLNDVEMEGGDSRCLVYSPDGRQLLVGSVTGKLQVWDFGSKAVRPHVVKGHEAEISCASFHPKGSFFVTCDKDQKCIARSSTTLLPIWSNYNATGAISTLSFSSDGKRLVTGDLRGFVKTWDAMTGSLLSICHVEKTDFSPEQKIVAVRCIPDSEEVVLTASTGPIQVWDLGSRQCKMRFASHSACNRSLVLSSDGKTVVSGQGNGAISVWDMSSGTRRKSWSAHTSAVLGLALNTDGSRFASVGWDGRMKVWSM
jgi:WD40 repeat protein